MIHFITGKPGGGKSYYAVRQLVKELEVSERWIVTNLSLNLEALAEYAHNNIQKAVDVSKRVRILSDQEVRRFWVHYPAFTIEKTCRPLGADMPCVADFAELESRDNPGTLFIIDECHLHFAARDWQKIGPECEYFFSQHRKLKSDVLLITQHCEKVDKNMRRNAQDFTTIRNMETEKLWLGVTLKKTLRRATFLQQPMRNDAPMETGYFKLDVSGMCTLYNTAAGVGIVGRLDVVQNHKGRSIWVWVALLCCLAGVAWCVPKGLAWGTKFLVKGSIVGAQDMAKTVRATVVGKPTNDIQIVALPKKDLEPAKEPERKRVYMTGIFPSPTGVKVALSDGRVVLPDSCSSRWCVIGTNRYEFK